MNGRQAYFPGLDGLRAVSVCLVLLHHIGMFFNWWPFQEGSQGLSMFFGRMMLLGFVGVDVFFVISGFLIAGLLLEDIDGPLRLKRFYFRRAFKILPQYLTCVLSGIFLSIVVLQEEYPWSTYLGYFLFVQNYGYQINGLRHLWTIAVEEHFYVFLPLVFGGIWALFKNPSQRIRVLVVVCLVLIFTANGLRWIDHHQAGLASINQPPDWQWTHRRFDALVFGCLLRLCFSFFQQVKEEFSTLPLLLLVSGCFALGFLFKLGQMTGWIDYSVLYVGCGFIMMAITMGAGFLTKLLEQPWIRFIGQNSYGIYIWHLATIFLFRDLYVQTRSVWFIVCYVLSSLVLGIVSTMTLEKRFLQLRKRIAP